VREIGKLLIRTTTSENLWGVICSSHDDVMVGLNGGTGLN
jgi:hypothetical protein